MAGNAVLPHLQQAGEHRDAECEVAADLGVSRVEHLVDLLQLGGARAHPRLQAQVQLAQLLVLALGQGQQLGVLLLQAAPCQRVAHHQQHVLVVPGFGDVAVDLTPVDGRHGRPDVGITRQQDAHRVGLAQPHRFQQAGAVHCRHAHVRDHQVHRLLGQQGQCIGAAGGLQHLVAVRPEQAAQRAQHRRLVVHQQQDRAAGSRSRSSGGRGVRCGHGLAPGG